MKYGIVSAPIRLALWAIPLALAAACAPAAPSPTPPSPTAPAELAQAEAVLTGYFDALARGDFAAAAELYAGSLTMLREWNPDVNPDDGPRLLERYCTQNGGVCLPVESFARREAVAEDAFLFTVQFANPDGTTFEIGPCCGEEDTGQRARQFNYVVLLVYDGFRVFKLPPNLP